jgi:hypothetical protein
LENGSRITHWHILNQARDTKGLAAIHLTLICRELSSDQFHKRRFAGSVSTEESDTLARLDGQGNPIKNRRATKAD